MNRILSVNGGSDDLIEAFGIEGEDEFNVICDGPYMGSLFVKSESYECEIQIACIYNGSWSFAVSDAEPEGIAWDYFDVMSRKWGDPVEYSETLMIVCPEDSVLRFEPPGKR